MSIKSEFMELGVEVPMNHRQRIHQVSELKEDNLDDICNQRSISKPIICDEFAGLTKEENVKPEKEK